MGARNATRRTGTRVNSGGFGGFSRVIGNVELNPDETPEAFGQYTPQSPPFNPSPPILTTAPPSPRPTPSPSATPRSSPPARTDPSGAGLTPSRLGGNTLRSLPNERWNPEGSFASTGGRSPNFITNPGDDWTGMDYRTTGNQFTELPRLIYDETRYVDSGNGFAELPSNIYDESRYVSTDTNAFTELPGSVYDETPRMAGEPRVDTPRREGDNGMGDEPVLFADPSTQSPSLTVNPGDGSGPGSFSRAGRDIGNFGSNMTIGQFLNTPLSFMNFAQNRGVGPGNIDLSQQGQDNYRAGSGVYRDSGNSFTEIPGSVYISPEERQYYADRGEAPPVTSHGTAEDEQTSTSRSASPQAQNPTGGPMSATQYAQATFGGLTPTGYRDTRGSATFDSQASNAQQMWYQSMGGNPNNTGTTTDRGQDIFYNPRQNRGRLDEDGNIIKVAGSDALGFSPDRFDPWVLPGQGAGTSFDANKHNAWIVAHNKDKIARVAAARKAGKG